MIKIEQATEMIANPASYVFVTDGYRFSGIPTAVAGNMIVMRTLWSDTDTYDLADLDATDVPATPVEMFEHQIREERNHTEYSVL